MILALIGAAMALPVIGDAQVAVGEKAFDFLKTTLMETPLSFNSEEVGGPYECWDRVGVRNVSLTANLEDISIILEDGYLLISIDVAELSGEDMVIFLEDDDLFDVCPGMERDLHYFTLSNLHVEMSLTPQVINGEIELRVNDTPSVSGNIDMDIDWFPDGLALFFFEDLIFETIADQISDTLPAVLSDYSALSFAAGDGKYEFDLAFTDAVVESDALMMGADLALEVNSESECENEGLPVNGARPELNFDKIDEVSLGIGLTEHVVNQGVMDMWASGFFCLNRSDFQSLFDDIKGLFDASAGELEAEAELNQPATIMLDTSGMHAQVEQASIQIFSGESSSLLLHAVMNINTDLSLTVDRSVSSLGIAIQDLEIEFTTLEIESILTDNPYAEANLKRFIEKWVVEQIESQLQDLTLFQSVFRAAGAYMFVDEIDHQNNGLTTYITLYHETDPAVDLIPPETEGVVNVQEDATAIAFWGGTDDREGQLAYSYRLDGGSWSSWTTEQEKGFENLEPGAHVLDIKSRDRWWNEDQSPVNIPFDIVPPTLNTNESDAKVKEQTCGCNTGPQARWSWILLFSCVLMAYKRREGGIFSVKSNF